MSALAGYLALGTLDPVSRAFTEVTAAGYARQPLALDLDVPQLGGAIDTGGDVLRNSNVVRFPAPTGLDWPAVNAAAIFTVASGGALQLAFPLGAMSGPHQRGTPWLFALGVLAFGLNADEITSTLGGRIVLAGEALIVAGVVTIGGVSLGGTLPGGTLPAFTMLPAVTGTPLVGQVLTTTLGTATGSPTGVAVQWNRNGAPITGATASTYTATPADLGATLTATVTASNAAGSASATGNGSMVVSRVVANAQTVQVGGLIGTAQQNATAPRSYSIGIVGSEPIASGSGSEVRFEVRGQDCATDFDQVGTRNRAELTLARQLPFYSGSTFDLDIKLEGNGTLTDRQWLIPFQVHADDTLNTSPVFALNVVTVNGAEVVNIVANTGPDGAHPTYRVFNTGAAQRPFSRDAWHTFHVEFTPDKNEGQGRIRVVMDGTEMLNVSGISTGFGTAAALSYAKVGIYAGLPTQAADTGLVLHVRNVTCTVPAAPAGFTYLADPDGSRLIDGTDTFLMEAA